MLGKLIGRRWQKAVVAGVTGTALVLTLASPASASTSHEAGTSAGIKWSAYETTTNRGHGTCSGNASIYWSTPNQAEEVGVQNSIEHALNPLEVGSEGAYSVKVQSGGIEYYSTGAQPCSGEPNTVKTTRLFSNASTAKAMATLHGDAELNGGQSFKQNFFASILFTVIALSISVAIMGAGALVLGATVAGDSVPLILFAGCIGQAAGEAVYAKMLKQPWQGILGSASAACLTGALEGLGIAKLIKLAKPLINAIGQTFVRTFPDMTQTLAYAAMVLRS